MAPGVLHRVIHGTPNPDPWQREYLTVRPGLLHGHRRHRVRHADYPGIIPHKSSSSTTTTGTTGKETEATVRGTIVSGLTDMDIRRLDIFEGDQYVRRKVKVQVLTGVALDELAPENVASAGEASSSAPSRASQGTDAETKKDSTFEEVMAETYIWNEGEDTLEEAEWDFEAFKRDKMRAWMGIAETGEATDGVEVDEGFADVDRAVEEEEKKRKAGNGGHDPTGGRGVNGHITRQLFDAAA